MARLQILELPSGINDERPPFILVIDQVAPGAVEAICAAERTTAELIGACAVFSFEETVDIPANEPVPLTELTVGGDEEIRRLAEERDELHAEIGLAHGQLHSAALSAIRGKHANMRELIGRAERAEAERDEARSWARHGYEIGQKHCGWTDYGVAPDWLTEGWPPAFDGCEHLKQAAKLEEAEAIRKRVANECKAALTDALGMDRTRDWDDIRNAAAGIRKQRDAHAEAVERVRSAPTEPEVMDAQQERPGVWEHGYRCGVLAAKSALRPRDEPTVKP